MMTDCFGVRDQRPVACSPSRPSLSPLGQEWYCVRTQQKHEHIAAAQLRQQGDVEVFLPRIRYRRPTRLGPVWVTEALFKDYIFARFDLAVALRRVRHARGVCGIVHFGEHWPTVPERSIQELKAALGGEDTRVIEDPMNVGDSAQITSGAMCGLDAVVTRVMPAKQRVAVLIEFLGRQTVLEMDRHQLRFAADEASHRIRTPVWDQSVSLGQTLD